MQVVHRRSCTDLYQARYGFVPITRHKYLNTVGVAIMPQFGINRGSDDSDDDAQTEAEVQRSYNDLYGEDIREETIPEDSPVELVAFEKDPKPRLPINHLPTQAHLPFLFARVTKLVTERNVLVDLKKFEEVRESFMSEIRDEEATLMNKAEEDATKKATAASLAEPETSQTLEDRFLKVAEDTGGDKSIRLSRTSSEPARLASYLNSLESRPESDLTLLIHQARPAASTLLRVQSQPTYVVAREWNENERKEMKFWLMVANKIVGCLGTMVQDVAGKYRVTPARRSIKQPRRK